MSSLKNIQSGQGHTFDKSFALCNRAPCLNEGTKCQGVSNKLFNATHHTLIISTFNILSFQLSRGLWSPHRIYKNFIRRATSANAEDISDGYFLFIVVKALNELLQN